MQSSRGDSDTATRPFIRQRERERERERDASARNLLPFGVFFLLLLWLVVASTIKCRHRHRVVFDRFAVRLDGRGRQYGDLLQTLPRGNATEDGRSRRKINSVYAAVIRFRFDARSCCLSKVIKVTAM